MLASGNYLPKTLNRVDKIVQQQNLLQTNINKEIELSDDIE